MKGFILESSLVMGHLCCALYTVQEALSAMNLCAASLRRAVQDMTKMRKALAKVRKQQEKAKTTAAAAQDPAASRALAGRTSFSKCLSPTDPMIIRSMKSLLVKRPMKSIKEPEELVNGTSDATMPFVMRKGRGLTKHLIKDVSMRGHLDATVQEFCKSIEQGQDAKSVFLGCLGLGYFFIIMSDVRLSDMSDMSNIS